MQLRTPSQKPSQRSVAPVRAPSDPAEELRQLLLGGRAGDIEMPSLADLVAAAVDLATLDRRKILLPLGGDPTEFALVRKGSNVLVSCYKTGPAPEVVCLGQPVPMDAFVGACERAAQACARQGSGSRRWAEHLASKVGAASVHDDPSGVRGSAVVRNGGASEPPDGSVALAFGFSASIDRASCAASSPSGQSDMHALLFGGALWAYVRGRKLCLPGGPVMLIALRMLAAVRALVEAAQDRRTAYVRLKHDAFYIGARLERTGSVALTLTSEGEGSCTAASLTLADAALPILRLVTDLLRALVGVERWQSRNLKVRSLRDEVRNLRRRVRSQSRAKGFVNGDPERLRMTQSTAAPVQRCCPPPPVSAGRLRFSERWRISVEGLNAGGTFFCGDRFVLATPERIVGVDREQGGLLWVREGCGAVSLMAGAVLVRLDGDGGVQLCDVEDGEPYAVTRVSPRTGGEPIAMAVGGGSIPPVAVIAEGADRLVAIDLRTAEHRWKFSAPGAGKFQMCRVGRLMLVAVGDGALQALDAVSGEVAWCFVEDVVFDYAPVVVRDVVVVVGRVPGPSGSGVVFGIDLFSGCVRWTQTCAAPTAAPCAAGSVVIVPIDRDQPWIAAFRPTDGAPLWTRPDVGLSLGAAVLPVDGSLFVNSTKGDLTAVALHTGEVQWERKLADPLVDDVPRRLEPVLRGAALFVPSASVNVLRPMDGMEIGDASACDLVPDLMRVDERGWVYVGEESGYMAAYAPAPQLRLIRGAATD